MTEWTSTVTFRSRAAILTRNSEGHWWMRFADEPDGDIQDFSIKELDYWNDYVYEWRSGN